MCVRAFFNSNNENDDDDDDDDDGDNDDDAKIGTLLEHLLRFS